MRFSGELKLGKVDAKMPNTGEPVVLEGIEIKYDTTCSIAEVKDLIGIIKDLPDVIAEVVSKAKKHEQQLTSEESVNEKAS